MFNIYENRKIFFIIPAIIIIIGIVMTFVPGLNFDIDFRGGTSFTVDMGKEVSNDEISNTIKDVLGYQPSSIQKSDGNTVVIKVFNKNNGEGVLDTEMRSKITNALTEKFGLNEQSILSVDNVSPSVGNELKMQSLLALTAAIILMLVYIVIRFEFLSGVAATVSLVHDVLIIVSVYSIFQIPVNTSFIAAILTIIGYSINDTIVIFDRIRENYRFASKKDDFAVVAEKSVWQCMTRSINTSATTLFSIVALFAIGVSSLREFTFPLIIGIVSGVYSTVFIATPVWIMMRGRKIVK